LDVECSAPSGLLQGGRHVGCRTQRRAFFSIEKTSGLVCFSESLSNPSRGGFKDSSRRPELVLSLSGIIRLHGKRFAAYTLSGRLCLAESLQSLDDSRPFQCFQGFGIDFKGHGASVAMSGAREG